MKIKYTITEERKIINNELVSGFNVDVQIENMTPLEMPSTLLAERMDAVKGLIHQFFQQNKKHQDALKKEKELFQQGNSTHLQSSNPASDTKANESREIL